MSLAEAPRTDGAPFAGHRGFEDLGVDRLTALLARYRGWIAALDAPDDQPIRPQPTNARPYCVAVVAELEAVLAARAAAPVTA